MTKGDLPKERVDPFLLGEFLVRPDLNRIQLGDEVVQVEPKVMQVLVFLAHHPGRVLSRDALMDEVWREVIVSDETLTVAVSELRRILKDDARSPRFIETIRKGGYRLICPVIPREEEGISCRTMEETKQSQGAAPTAAPGVTPGPAPAAAPAACSKEPSGEPPTESTGDSLPSRPAELVPGLSPASPPLSAVDMLPRSSPGPSREAESPVPSGKASGRQLVPLVVLSILTAAALSLLLRQQLAPSSSSRVLSGNPVTTYAGIEGDPAVSEDGTRVAFTWTGPRGDNHDVYIKQRGSDTPFRLTQDPATERHPAWSPDGTSIAFARLGTDGGIFLIPSLGGSPRRVVATAGLIFGIDWSPDGRELVYSASDTAGAMARVRAVNLESLEIKDLTGPGEEYTCDSAPRYSPDGRWIAFARSRHPAYEQDIYLMPAEGHPARRLTHAQRSIRGFAWERSAAAIVFAAAPFSELRLWRADLRGNPPTWIPTVSQSAAYPSISRSADVLVFQESSTDFNIWKAELPREGGMRLAECPLIVSTRSDLQPAWSPDGSRIAFLSNRSGQRQIWVCDSTGADPRQVTRMDGRFASDIHWSPDSRQIAFSSMVRGQETAFVLRLDTQHTRRLAVSPDHQIVRGWSADGEWIYLDTNPGGNWQIWRMRPGGNDARKVSDEGCVMIGLLPASQRLIYMKTNLSGIFAMGVDGGASTLLIEDRVIVPWVDWVVTDDGAYFLGHGPQGPFLGRYDTASRTQEVLSRIPARAVSSLALAPGGHSCLLVCSDRVEADLVWIDGYRGD